MSDMDKDCSLGDTRTIDESIADRVRSIADTVDRPGTYRLLHEIADELDVDA